MTSASHDNDHWEDALDGIGLLEGGKPSPHTLSLFFANALYPDFEALSAEAYKRSGASLLIGCTGRGVIGGGTEIEGRPALAILHLDLPGATLFPSHVESGDQPGERAADWHRWLGATSDQVNAWLVIADPFTFDSDGFLRGLAAAYPNAAIGGGLASGLAYGDWTWLMLNERPFSSGAVVLGIGGGYTLRAMAVPGVVPVGEPGVITAVNGNLIQTIDDRPAYQVMREFTSKLDEELQWQAQENLLAALPAGPDVKMMVMRNVTGSDRRSGVVRVDAKPQAGQRIQFHLADPDRADAELRDALRTATSDIKAANPAAALLCPSTNRGIELFRVPNHDMDAVADALPGLPVGGFFSSGEIAPAGGTPLVFGSTAGLTFFVKQ